MSKKIISIAILLLGIIHCQAQDVKDKYLGSLKKVFSDCTFQYKMQCIYPDGTSINIKGVVATKGEDLYYDSSNYRFILKNKNWYIVADHDEKMVSIRNVKELNKRLEPVGSLNTASYLINDKSVYDNLKIDVIREDDKFVWVRLVFPSNDIVKSFDVKFIKSDNSPVSYTAKFKYPMDVVTTSSDQLTYADLVVESFNISPTSSVSVFDDSRIFQVVNASQVQLKKFTTYQHY